jgi:hypothetical protein
MTSPLTVEDAEQAIDELVAAWDAERPPSRVSAGQNLAFGPVMFAHVAHLHRLAAGVLTLHRADKMLVAMPLVRQSLECAMRAVWLEMYRDNLPALVHDGERQRRNALDEAARTGQIREDDAALQRSRDWCDRHEDVRGATSGSVFGQLCSEIALGTGIYAHYRLVSNFTHPGSMLTDMYIDIERAEAGGQNFITNPKMPAGGAWLKYEAYMLILGGLAWDRVDVTHHHRVLLTRLAALFDVPTDRLGMTAEGWRASYRADRDRKRRKKGGPVQSAREDLARSSDRVGKRRTELQRAETALSKAVTRAHDAGVPHGEVARYAGLDARRVELLPD